MPLSPVNRDELNEQVYASLAHAIVTGTLVPGQRLVEEELALQFGVSRAPVRDALRQLEHDGLVTPKGQRGKIVSVLTADDTWEVYSLRGALEGLAFRTVAGKLTPVSTRELEDIVAEMTVQADRGDLLALSALDVRFHEAVCRLSGHRRLMQTWTMMSRQIRLLSHLVVDIQYGHTADELSSIPARHTALFDLLQGGDAAAAEAGVRQHIEVVADRNIKIMRDRDASRSPASSMSEVGS
jgi:DNA-binding GntR family transcriptional regulator